MHFLILVTFVHFREVSYKIIQVIYDEWFMMIPFWRFDGQIHRRQIGNSPWNDPKGWFCFRLSYVFVNNDDMYTEGNLTWWMIDGWLVLSFDVLVLRDHVAIGYDELESLTRRKKHSQPLWTYKSDASGKVFWKCLGIHAGIWGFPKTVGFPNNHGFSY